MWVCVGGGGVEKEREKKGGVKGEKGLRGKEEIRSKARLGREARFLQAIGLPYHPFNPEHMNYTGSEAD